MNVRFMSIEIDLDDYQDEIKAYVIANYAPEDTFPEHYLAQWAEANGYKKETDDGR